MADKYEVLFIPSWQSVSEAGRTRSTARHNGEDEFTKKEALVVARKLKQRGDKSIKIRKV